MSNIIDKISHILTL